MFPNNQNDNQPPNRPPNRPDGGNNGGNNNGGPTGPGGLPPEWQRWVWPALLLLVLGWLLFSMQDFFTTSGPTSRVPYSVLLEQVELDNVAGIEVVDQTANGTFSRAVTFTDPATGRSVSAQRFQTTLLPGSNDDFFTALNQSSALILADQPSPNVILLFLLNIAPLLLIVGLFVWMARRTQRQMGGAFSFGRTQAREYNVERPQVTFEDVAGQEAAKTELIEVVDFLKEPDKYIALGARIPRGVLLVGPPGTRRNSSRCSSAWAHRASATCSSAPATTAPASSSSTRSTRWAVSVGQAWAAAMTSVSRPSTRCWLKWTASTRPTA